MELLEHFLHIYFHNFSEQPYELDSGFLHLCYFDYDHETTS